MSPLYGQVRKAQQGGGSTPSQIDVETGDIGLKRAIAESMLLSHPFGPAFGTERGTSPLAFGGNVALDLQDFAKGTGAIMNTLAGGATGLLQPLANPMSGIKYGPYYQDIEGVRTLQPGVINQSLTNLGATAKALPGAIKDAYGQTYFGTSPSLVDKIGAFTTTPIRHPLFFASDVSMIGSLPALGVRLGMGGLKGLAKVGVTKPLAEAQALSTGQKIRPSKPSPILTEGQVEALPSLSREYSPNYAKALAQKYITDKPLFQLGVQQLDTMLNKDALVAGTIDLFHDLVGTKPSSSLLGNQSTARRMMNIEAAKTYEGKRVAEAVASQMMKPFNDAFKQLTPAQQAGFPYLLEYGPFSEVFKADVLSFRESLSVVKNELNALSKQLEDLLVTESDLYSKGVEAIRPLINKKKLPPSDDLLLPDGNYTAVVTDDGSIYYGKSINESHFEIILRRKIPPERVVKGGIVVDGIWQSTNSETVQYGQIARNKMLTGVKQATAELKDQLQNKYDEINKVRLEAEAHLTWLDGQGLEVRWNVPDVVKQAYVEYKRFKDTFSHKQMLDLGLISEKTVSSLPFKQFAAGTLNKPISQLTKADFKKAAKALAILRKENPWYTPVYNPTRRPDRAGELGVRQSGLGKYNPEFMKATFNVERLVGRIRQMMVYYDKVLKNFARPINKKEGVMKGWRPFNPNLARFDANRLQEMSNDFLRALEETGDPEAAFVKASEGIVQDNIGLEEFFAKAGTTAETINKYHEDWVKGEISTEGAPYAVAPGGITVRDRFYPYEDLIKLGQGYEYQIPEVVAGKMREMYHFTTGNRYLDGLMDTLDVSNYLFKLSVLGYSPTFITTNRVGNALMATFTGVGPRNLVKASQISKNKPEVFPEEIKMNLIREFVPEMEKATALKKKLSTGYDALFARSGNQWVRNMGALIKTRVAQGAKLYTEVAQTTFDVNHYLETMERKAVYIKKGEEVFGKYFGDTTRGMMTTEEMLETISHYPDLMEKALQETYKVLGDYSRFTPNERKYLKRFMPFYSWNRTILRYTLMLPEEHPLRSAILLRISDIYRRAVEETNQDLYEDYRTGWQTGMGTVYVGGSSINPLESALTFLDAQKLASSLTPLVKSGIESATGVSTFTGRPLTSEDIASGGSMRKMLNQATGKTEWVPNKGVSAEERIGAFTASNVRAHIPRIILGNLERAIAGNRLYDTSLFSGYSKEGPLSSSEEVFNAVMPGAIIKLPIKGKIAQMKERLAEQEYSRRKRSKPKINPRPRGDEEESRGSRVGIINPRP